MGAILVPIVIVLIALVAGAIALKQFMTRERVRADRLYGGHEATVRYHVPHGQDPAAVLLGLSRAGYEAAIDPVVGETNEVVIGCGDHNGLDREQVRLALADITQLNMEGDQLDAVPSIHFADE